METIGRLDDGRYVVVLSAREYGKCSELDDERPVTVSTGHVSPLGYKKRLCTGVSVCRDIVDGWTIREIARKHGRTEGVVHGYHRLVCIALAKMSTRINAEEMFDGLEWDIRGMRRTKEKWLVALGALEDHYGIFMLEEAA